MTKKYKYYTFGSCIDDHIILRLKIMQETGFLGKITFAYYEESSKIHDQKIISDYELPNVDVMSIRSRLG